MPQKTIDAPLVNSPWEESKKHWRHDQKTRRFGRMPGAAMPRRGAEKRDDFSTLIV